MFQFDEHDKQFGSNHRLLDSDVVSIARVFCHGTSLHEKCNPAGGSDGAIRLAIMRFSDYLPQFPAGALQTSRSLAWCLSAHFLQ